MGIGIFIGAIGLLALLIARRVGAKNRVEEIDDLDDYFDEFDNYND